MEQDVKDYLAWLFENASPAKLLSIQTALKKRPNATVRELSELYESPRSLNIGRNMQIAEEVAAGGIGVRAIYYPKAGDGYQNHKHTYDHLTYLVKGSVIAYSPELKKQRVFHAPKMILTNANVEHQFIANEDDTHMLCLHRTDELEERGIPFKVVDPSNLIDGDN